MEPTSSSRTAWKRIITVGWLCANLLGVVSFLHWSASCCWIEPELRGEDVATGGVAVVWAFGPLPILVAFVLADAAWAYFAETKSSQGHRLKPLVTPLLMLAVWGAAFVFDGLHH